MNYMYVIKKGNLYVAKPGRSNAYTNRLKNAQKYANKEDAERNKCDNEHIANVSDEID